MGANEFRGFSTADPFYQYRITGWTSSPVAANAGVAAFCFNQPMQPPTNNTSDEPVKLKASYDLMAAATVVGSRNKPAFTDEQKFKDAIVRTIYNGYGFDASGIKDKFHLTQEDFYHATQLAVWRFMENMFTQGGRTNPTEETFANVDNQAKMNRDIAKAAAAMVGATPHTSSSKHLKTRCFASM